MRRLPIAVVALICASLFACSGNGAGNSTVVPTRTPAAVPSATPAGANTLVIAASIDQQNLQFVPPIVSVKPGDVVLFTNSDSALHMIKVDSTIIADTMKKGDTVRWTAPSPGQYRVTCDYHPQMSATIDVSR